jgi:hypothetical protein
MSRHCYVTLHDTLLPAGGAAADVVSSGTAKALSRGPVLLAEADGRSLLTAADELKSGKDLIQTPFGNLPQISEKV